MSMGTRISFTVFSVPAHLRIPHLLSDLQLILRVGKLTFHVHAFCAKVAHSIVFCNKRRVLHHVFELAVFVRAFAVEHANDTIFRVMNELAHSIGAMWVKFTFLSRFFILISLMGSKLISRFLMKVRTVSSTAVLSKFAANLTFFAYFFHFLYL